MRIFLFPLCHILFHIQRSVGMQKTPDLTDSKFAPRRAKLIRIVENGNGKSDGRHPVRRFFHKAAKFFSSPCTLTGKSKLGRSLFFHWYGFPECYFYRDMIKFHQQDRAIGNLLKLEEKYQSEMNKLSKIIYNGQATEAVNSSIVRQEEFRKNREKLAWKNSKHSDDFVAKFHKTGGRKKMAMLLAATAIVAGASFAILNIPMAHLLPFAAKISEATRLAGNIAAVALVAAAALTVLVRKITKIHAEKGWMRIREILKGTEHEIPEAKGSVEIAVAAK